MKKINKHGLKMRGLKAASGETKDYGCYSGHYIQISYDTDTGDILTDYHYSLGQNSWTQYHDPAIITVAIASSHMTMQEIADAIALALEGEREWQVAELIRMLG